MISTGSFLTETGASNKQSELVKKLTAAWEKKNSKTARAGGASLMALSLAACGGSDDEVAALTLNGATYDTLQDVYDAGETAGIASVDVDAAEARGAEEAVDEINAAIADAGIVVADDATTAETIAAIAASNDTEVMMSQADYDEDLQEARDGVDIEADNAAAIDNAVVALGLDGISTLAELNTAYTNAISSSNPVLTSAATNIATMSDNSDTVDATTRNSLQTGDDITDASTTDSDVLNANVTVANAAPTMRNVETVNVTGDFLVTGLALTNVSGTNTLNLSTVLAGGTATVTDAAAAAAANIVIGANVTTVSVTALAGGTGAAGVTVDGGAATTVALEAGAGTDIFNVTTADGAALNLGAVGAFAAADTVNVTLNGDATITTAVAMGTMNIASATDATVTAATAVGTATDFTGAGNITLSGDASVLAAATSIASTGTGTLTLDLTTVAGDNVSTVAADVINHNHAGGTGLTMAETSSLNLVADAGGATIQLSAAGTLTMNVSETQTSAITTGNAVTALTVSATPDAATDTANGAVITMADLALDANTVNVAITGTEALTLTDLSTAAATTINALNMSGDLTISELGAFDVTLFLGNGTNSITSTNVAAGFTLEGGSGADTITLTGAAVNASTVNGNDGDDTILGGDAADTIDGGDGDDAINGDAGVDNITTGAGSDTVTMVSGEDGDTIADFVLGTDMLVLTGAANAGLDLSSITPTTGLYAIDGGTGNFDVTLTGNTATDIRDSVTLGTQSTAAVAGGAAAAVTTYTSVTTAGATVAGDADDVIALGGAHTVTLGSGSDTLIADIAATGSTVADFVMGTDTLILTGIATGSLDLTSITPTTNTYDFGGNSVTLTGNTATDVSGSVVLGTNAATFTIFATGSVTGGTGNDNITTAAASAETVVFIDNGGVDTISLVETTATGAALDLLNFDNMTGISASGVAVAANAAKVADALDGEVYIFADGSDGTGTEAIDFNGADGTAGLGSAEVLADVAAFLEAGMTEANGENYIALINTANGVTDIYAAYLVAGDSDGIDAADLTLLGSIDADGVLAADNIV